MKKVLYTKFSRERSEQFRIATAISEENGIRRVTKTALSPAASGHVGQMAENYPKLEKMYQFPKLRICPCSRVDETTVEFPYVEGKSLDLLLTEHVEQGDYESVKQDVRLLYDILTSVKGLEEFKVTKEFERMFGKTALPEGQKASGISNLDMLFANILVGDALYLVDYEWVFDFPIPVSYLFARSLMLHAMLQTLKKEQLEELYAIGGVKVEEIPVYYQMEVQFQKYVTGEDELHVLSRLYPRMKTHSFFLDYWNTEHVYYAVQLLGIPKDAPEKEEELLFSLYFLGEVHETAVISDTDRYQAFLLKPVDTDCILTMRHLNGLAGQRIQEIPVSFHNADLCYGAEYHFNQAPVMRIENQGYEEISFDYMVWHRNNSLISEEIKFRKESEKLHRELKLYAGWYLAIKKAGRALKRKIGK